MNVVALIPACNEAALIGETLEALVNQHRVPDRIIVVANGCTDDTEEIARRYPVEVLSLPRLPHKKPQALNIAWQRYAHDADIVICLDADTVLPRHAVAHWVDELQADPALGGSSSKFTMLTQAKKKLVFGGDHSPESWWAAYLTRLQAAEFSAWTETALRRGHTTVLAGTACAIRGSVLREVAVSTGQEGPWSYHSLTEDWLLTYEVRRLGYRCQVSPTVRAYTDSMKTTKALLSQRDKWQVGTVQDLLRVGVNRLTLIDWWQQVAGLLMAVVRVLWVSLLVTFLVTDLLVLQWVWWLAVPMSFAVAQGLLSLRVPHRDWLDVALGFAMVPSEHFAWLRAYWFVKGWAKALRMKITGVQQDLWAAQSAAEAK